MAELILDRGKVRSFLRQHPWIFSTSVKSFEGRARPGDTVDVMDDKGRLIANAKQEALEKKLRQAITEGAERAQA